jgi:hypothetical protein
MAQRLIGVLDGSGTVIHTYPVTLGPDEDHADDSRYKAKALEAAAHGRLVSDAELPSLSARIHVGVKRNLELIQLRTQTQLEINTPAHAVISWVLPPSNYVCV